jgi:MHS family proline/betaine transporter-like MFS transporter
VSSPPSSPARRAILAAVIGNVLEWYDFAVYAYMATIIAKQFFPAQDEISSLLSAFAAFGVGFVVRPLGGIVIGRLGDVRGRKAALILTIVLMAAGTVMIGLTPSYASIGVAAPMLILIARLLQGFSAGGEWGGATAFIVEWAPAGRRGLYGSLQQSSVAFGLLLGSGIAAAVSTLLSAATVEGWAWRIPFLLGGLLAPIGLYMRRNIEETPMFTRFVRQDAAPAASSSAWRLAGRALGFTVLWTVSYYIVLSYMPTFLQKQVGLPRTQALWATTAGLLLLVLAAPALGHLSDRIGRKPLLLTACVAFVLLPYPLFTWMLSAPSLAIAIVVQLVLALAIAVFSGPGPAAIAEIFPTAVRSTWMSAGYSIAVAVFGGFAPFIATWLIARTGNPVSPSFYVIAAAFVSMAVIARMEETAGKPLR